MKGELPDEGIRDLDLTLEKGELEKRGREVPEMYDWRRRRIENVLELLKDYKDLDTISLEYNNPPGRHFKIKVGTVREYGNRLLQIKVGEKLLEDEERDMEDLFTGGHYGAWTIVGTNKTNSSWPREERPDDELPRNV